ncbi:MAG: sugar transferase [Acidobacteriota bacterium]
MSTSAVIEPEWGSDHQENLLRHNRILSEESFEKALVLERKRSERSRDPFILVNIDVSRLRDGTGQVDPAFQDVLFSLMLCTFRETDIVGWYHRDHTAAAILTELGDGRKLDVLSIVLAKVRHCLNCHLPDDVAHKVSVSAVRFPDNFRGELSDEVLDVLYPDLAGGETARRSAGALKRGIDLTLSLILLLMLSPLLLLIAVAIKLTSKGPILFRQERLGQFGKPFQFLKFRSMYINTDNSIHEKYIQEFIGNGKATKTDVNGKPLFKLVEDPRVTPVGRILRKLSLDELPQFFNVARGEMSLVGPRPPIRYELKNYDVWHRRRILEVRPGITGMWQVYGRSRTTFDEMVRMDLRYARTWSLWLDLKLLCQTPAAVLRGDGAV